MKFKVLTLLPLVMALSMVASPVLAAPATIVDSTPGTATNNGTVGVSEYFGSTSGINSGFANVIGSNSQLHVDSDGSGNLNFGLITGGGGYNDAMVIYIDSVAGGFSSTSTFNDTGDGCRRAISGFNGSSRSILNFAPGFQADYAICMDTGFAGVWQLTGPGSLPLPTSANRTTTTSGHYEMNLTMANLGLAAGGTLKYVATYLNPSNAFRSNEFHGVAQSTVPGGNPGLATVTLASGDFNTFTSYAPVVASAGGSSAGYTTLKGAFDAINAGVHQGAVSIAINADTTEAAAAVLNASGAGSANYTSLLIQPAGGAARTVSGSIAGGPLVDFNGADNVTVDGLNSGGNALTIANTSTAATSGTSTIRFQADATNNLLTRLTVLGSASMTTGVNGGNIWFGSASTTTGNDNNTVSYSNIGPAGANLPSKGIYFSGSSNSDPGTANSGIVIDNNTIYDTFSPTVNSAGIDLNSGSTAVTISNNRFYQTAPRTMTATSFMAHYGISINNSFGNGYQVTGNTIGFASSAGTGTYTLVFPAGSTDRFNPINLAVGATTASSVQGNTIAGIAMSGGSSGNGSGAPFSAIGGFGLVAVGTVTGNTIGSQSELNSITYTSDSSSSSQLNAIYWRGASPATISNNTIGGITTGNTGTGSASFVGILAFSGLPTLVAETNTIGGSVADSIYNTSTAASATTSGIYATGASNTLTSNTIRNMTAAGGTGSTVSTPLAGIVVPFAGTTHTIQRNTIHSLRHTAVAGTPYVHGIYFGATAGPNLIARNFIHSLGAASPAAVLNGIYMTASGATTFQNNMIRLGIDAAGGSLPAGPAINGIFVLPAAAVYDYRFYFNSVYVGGSGVGGSASTYAFNSQNTFGARNVRNNIFYNARSNGAGTGKHYAVRVAGGTAPNLTIDHNVYHTSGTGGVFGFYGADVASLAAWKTAVGQDANSLDGNPQYQNPTGTAATVDLHINPASMTPVEGVGVNIPSVTDDFDGQTRASLTPEDIGADAANLLPLAVTLASFDAQGQADHVLVTWETVSELDNRGFNLFRGTSPDGWDRRLNGTLIPSQSQGNPGGFEYVWNDHADLEPGQTYWYWLEDVSLSGATTLHGPVSATVQVPTAVTLGGFEAATGGASSFAGLAVAVGLAAAGGLFWRRRRQQAVKS